MTADSFATPPVSPLLPLRSLARHAALSALSSVQSALGWQAKGLARGRVQIVLLHSVLPHEEAGFRSLLAFLAKTHRFISYSRAVEHIASGQLDQPSLAFSFDDGMNNNLLAAKVLNEFGAPACFFVCTDMVGQTDASKVQRFCIERLHGPATGFLGWNDLEQMQRAGHEIGSHTRSHRRLSGLGAGEIADELHGSFEMLNVRLDPVKHFAWPYGKFSDVPPDLGASAAKAGYASCASGVRGCHVERAATDPVSLCLRRENLQANWPQSHVNYLLAKSALSAGAKDNVWLPRDAAESR